MKVLQNNQHLVFQSKKKKLKDRNNVKQQKRNKFFSTNVEEIYALY